MWAFALCAALIGIGVCGVFITTSPEPIWKGALSPALQEDIERSLDANAEKGTSLSVTGYPQPGPAEDSSVPQLTASVVQHQTDDRLIASTSSNTAKPESKVCYLTFDDGPSANTASILSTLGKYGIKATWFVCGNASNFSAIDDIWAQGHQIALHSNTHQYNDIYSSTSAFIEDIRAVGEKVRSRLGFFPTLIRFPGGSHNSYNASTASEIISEVANQGWHYFDWNVSIGDSTVPPSEVPRLVQNIIDGSQGCKSANVLMHDFDIKVTTAEALDEIIRYLIDEGYSFDYITAESFGYHF